MKNISVRPRGFFFFSLFFFLKSGLCWVDISFKNFKEILLPTGGGFLGLKESEG